MDLPLNARVYGFDGLCGQSQELILDRNTEEVTHLVVKGNHLPHTELLVPVELVAETTPHLIRLRCTRDRLAEMEPYLKVEVIEEKIPYYVPDPGLMPMEIPQPRRVTVRHKAIPSGEVAVRKGARVNATDGHVGRVDEFVVDPVTEQVTHLVIREGNVWGQRDVTIPVSEIDRIEEGAIYLKLDKGGVEALPSIPISSRYGLQILKRSG
jgi:sporulation protein YlmC with PRC-barrel domain